MARLLHWIAIVACLLVAAGFITFAADELDKGSKEQVGKVANIQEAEGAPQGTGEAAREKQHGLVREAIDDANDVLLAPFNGLVSEDDNIWVEHGIPALLALLAYGVGLVMLANSLPKPKAHGGDWRTEFS
jgi:hypothetical protein